MSSLDLHPLTSLSTVYATDEDVAVRASGDYSELVPDFAVVSTGSDGIIAGTPDWWTLSSATADFLAAGVQPGQVIRLDGPTRPFGPDGSEFAVHACTTGTITLRRIGMAPSSGQPPTAIPLTGIAWSIRTMGALLEDASYDLNQRLRIDPDSPFWNPVNLRDQRQLRQVCVLTVLLRQFTTATRSKDSDWAIKRTQAQQDLNDSLGRLAVRWGPQVGLEPPTSLQRARVIR